MECNRCPRVFSEVGFWNFDPEIIVTDVVFEQEHGDGHILAVTRGGCDVDGDQIWYGNEVDIEFNLRHYENSSLHNWGLAAGHEQGHAYGLAHTTGCAIMGNTASGCTDTYPTAGDIYGVTWVYYLASRR